MAESEPWTQGWSRHVYKRKTTANKRARAAGIDNDALREFLKKWPNNRRDIKKYKNEKKKKRNTCRLEASTSKNTRQFHGGEKCRLMHKLRLSHGERPRNMLPPNMLFHRVVAEERALTAASASPASPRALSPCPLWHRMQSERQKLREGERRWRKKGSLSNVKQIRDQDERVCQAENNILLIKVRLFLLSVTN